MAHVPAHESWPRRVSRRAFLRASGGLVATVTLAACAPAAPPGSAPLSTLAPTPASVAKLTAATVSTSWTVRAVPLLAAAKGYWKDAGLEVSTPVVGPGNAHMAAFIGGSVDFSLNINTDLIARSNAQGEKLYAVAGSSNRINYVLFGAPPIKSWAELKDKTVAIEGPASSTEYLVRDLASKHNLEAGKDFQFVTIAGTVQEREQAVIGGAAGAALGTNSDWPTLKALGLNWLGELSEVYPSFQQAVIAARGDVLDKQPAASAAFLKGIIRAFRFLQDPNNDTQVLQILKQSDVNVDEANWSELMSLQRLLWPADGGINLQGTEVVVKREQQANRLPASYDWRQLIRDEALKQAHKELGVSATH
jgi:ABC-type nitrate/sulfonate/bicarbonate transport system substrate-binding protein